MKDNRIKNMGKALKMELREHKSSFMVYFILRILVVAVMILQFLNGNFENVFLCVLTLILLIIPSLIQVNLRIELPTTLEIIMLLFIFSAEILGEIREYYIIYPFWDTMLHTLNGFLAAAIGFALVDILNRNEKFAFKMSPIFMALVAFCFSMTIGVLWEFFEFGVDTFLGFDMQKDTVVHRIASVMLDPAGGNKVTVLANITAVTVGGEELGLGGYLDIGLLDTMKDLLVNFVGAVIFSVIGFFYVKNRGKGSFARRFIPRLKRKEADFLTMVNDGQTKIKTVIFDIGNVLVDFNYSDCFHNYVADEEAYRKMVEATVKAPAWHEFDRGVWSDEEILNAFILKEPSIEQELRNMFAELKGVIKQREYTVPWIKELKQKGCRVLYLSNFPERTYRLHQKEMGFLKEMDGGILSYREKVIKPEEAIYKLLLERYQLRPEECVFVDDLAQNIEAAKKLGMHTILFTTWEKAVEELKQKGVR